MNPDFNELDGWKAPAPTDRVRQRALEESLRALRAAHAQPPAKSGWFWIGVPAATAAILAIFLLPWGQTARDIPLDSRTLAQFQAVFGSSLNAVISHGGRIDVETSEIAPPERGQPILILAATREGPVEILGFSGSPIDVLIGGRTTRIEPLISADGSVLLCGDQFLWGTQVKEGTLPPDFKLLRAIPLQPAT